MSADNYYVIRRTDDHRYVPLMGFASDDLNPIVSEARHLSYFDTPEAALDSVINEYSEYGHFIHDECHLTKDQFDAVTAARRELVQRFEYPIRDGIDEKIDPERIAEHLAAIADEWCASRGHTSTPEALFEPTEG